MNFRMPLFWALTAITIDVTSSQLGWKLVASQELSGNLSSTNYLLPRTVFFLVSSAFIWRGD